jgi:hypothetical protein
MTTMRLLAIVVLATFAVVKAVALPDRPAPGEPSHTQVNLIIPGINGFDSRNIVNIDDGEQGEVLKRFQSLASSKAGVTERSPLAREKWNE